MTASRLKSTTRFLILVGVLAGIVIGYGAAVYSTRSVPGVDTTPGADADTPSPGPLADPLNERATPEEYQERLMALGYSSGTEQAPEVSGVTINVPEKTYGTYTLYASAHAPTAHLIKMDGEIVHKWAYSFHMLWPDVDPGDQNVYYWRRAHLFENGDILAILEPHGIFKLDKDSKLLWENRCGAHHDLYVADNGHIFVLTRQKVMVDLGSGDRPVLEDLVTELDADGREIRSVSIMKALQNTAYASLLKDAPDHWDIFHTNSLKLIQPGVDSRIPAFKAGRVLLSIRELGTVAVLDLDSERIVWATKGQWFQQHEATLLDTGRLMLFDNKGNRGRSKVIEFDPATQEIAWSYGMKESEPLYSEFCGIAHRLPNGNTLINEAMPGRVIEVTPDSEIVWEFINPNRLESNPDVIATMMDVRRLPQSFTPQWLSDR